MSRLVALYPAEWRARYEDEFRAILAARPPSVGERVDIVRGAVDARMRPQLPGRQRLRDPFGFGPLAGFASLALAVFLMASGPVQTDEYGTYRDGANGFVPFILAFVLLSVGLVRVVDRLPADAFGARAAGSIAIIAGPLWSVMPWMLAVGVVFILALIGLAIGARRAGLWPTWSVVALVALVVPAASVFCASLFLPWYALRGVELFYLIGPLALVWLLVGALVTRGIPQPTGS